MNLAESTLATIQKGLEQGQCACIPQMLRTIHNMSRRLKDLATHELADIIGNDTVVLQKVIQAANSIGYNPGGIEVTTISEAIQVIGFDRVRGLTMSLILLEESNKSQSSEERRQAMISSLAAGILAENLAASHTHINPEVAFLCGALRGFGRILLATFMTDAYRQAESRSPALPDDAAYREVFGLTPTEISFFLLESSHLSAVLLETFRDYNPTTHRKAVLDASDLLLAIADFAYRLGLLVTRPHSTPAELERQFMALLNVFEPTLEIGRKQVLHCLVAFQKHLRSLVTGHELAFPKNVLCILAQRIELLNTDGEALNLDPTFATIPAPDAAPKPASAPRPPASESANDESGTAALLQGLAAMQSLADEELRIRNRAISDALSTLRTCLATQDVWLFLSTDEGRSFPYKDGIGSHSILLRNKVTIMPCDRSLFAVCLKRKEHIFISDADAPKFRAAMPDWFNRNVQVKSFALFCITAQAAPIGLIFVGWRAARSIQIPQNHLKLIRQLLDILAAIEC